MTDKAPEFEQTDRKGSTDAFIGAVGTSWTAIPAVSGNEIQSFCVANDDDNSVNESISISLDGGTTVLDVIYPGGYCYQLLKDAKTQIWIKGSINSVDYRVTLNREAA